MKNILLGAFGTLLFLHAATAAPVELKAKFTPGTRLVYHMEMSQESAMQVAGNPMGSQMKLGQDFAMSVLAARPEGGYDFEVEFLALNLDMKMNGNPMAAYDSTKPGDVANPMTQAFGKLKGAKIKYSTDAKGVVEHVVGVEQLLLSAGPGRDAISGFMNDDFFQQLTYDYLLPKKAVEPGEKWQSKLEIPAGPMGTLKANLDITFVGMEKTDGLNLAHLKVEGKYDGTEPSVEPTKIPMKIDLTGGGQTSDTYWDTDLGQMRTSHVDQTLNFTINGPNPAGGTEPMKIDVKSLQKVDMKLVEVGKVPPPEKK